VAADEVFFHAYFMKAGKGKLNKKDKTKKKDKEDESGEEGEDEIWKALVQSRPEIEGESGDGDFSDLDMDDMSDDSEEGEEDVGMGEGVELNLDSDVEDPDATDVDEDATAAASDDGFDLESADEGAFMRSDEEIPADFDDALQANVESEGEAVEKASKKDRKENDSRGKKRRKLKHLPTFASVEDYAKLLEGEDSE
jgi:ribosome biogenesis protein MAK21